MDKELDQKVVSRLLADLEQDASQRRENAAYSGSYGDNGATEVVNKVRFFKAGWNGVLPVEWQSTYDRIERDLAKTEDPEYNDYIRLKKKFENN